MGKERHVAVVVGRGFRSAAAGAYHRVYAARLDVRLTIVSDHDENSPHANWALVLSRFLEKYLETAIRSLGPADRPFVRCRTGARPARAGAQEWRRHLPPRTITERLSQTRLPRLSPPGNRRGDPGK